MNAITELEPDAMRHLLSYFARLADLGDPAPPRPIVDDLLEFLVAIARARLAYVEVPLGEERTFRAGYPHGDLEAVQRSISRGIVKTAMAECRTISTPGALTDDRFADLGSVRQHEIRAVLCTPVKVQGLVGVIYVQGLHELTAFHRELVEGLARRLGRRLAWPITSTSRHTMDEATEAFRRWFALEVLESYGWKVTDAVDALRISRSTVYELVRDLPARRRVKVG